MVNRDRELYLAHYQWWIELQVHEPVRVVTLLIKFLLLSLLFPSPIPIPKHNIAQPLTQGLKPNGGSQVWRHTTMKVIIHYSD